MLVVVTSVRRRSAGTLASGANVNTTPRAAARQAVRPTAGSGEAAAEGGRASTIPIPAFAPPSPCGATREEAPHVRQCVCPRDPGRPDLVAPAAAGGECPGVRQVLRRPHAGRRLH